MVQGSQKHRPKAGNPKTNKPKAGNEKFKNPKAGTQKMEHPKAGTQKTEHSKAGAQKTERPKAGTQKMEHSKAGAQKMEHPKVGAQKTKYPKATVSKADKQKTEKQKPDNNPSGTPNPGIPKSGSPKPNTGRLCPVAQKCGGCQWIGRGYQEQLAAKATRFRKLMEPYCRPEQIIAMEDPTHYRNKVHAVFGEDGRHNIISGTYEEKSHRIVPIDSCLIENQKADQIIVSIRKLLRSFKIRPYNEDTGYGLLRHVLVRTGHVTGQIMVVLVLGSPVMPSKNNFVKALLQLHPEITTVVVNVNGKQTSMILGEKEQVLYGKGYIEDELCGMRFRISPKSFYQVNPVQTEKLYGKAMEYARLTGKETVLDAYCGTGTIGMIASVHAGKVLGVELNKDAVRDARNNARGNHIHNIEFYQNDAGRFMSDMAEQGHRLDVLLMDPPRSGSDEAFLEAACRIRPDRIVYISCEPETLVRDLKYLTKHGYVVEKSVPVDMFPFTDCIEAVCLLSNRKPDTKVRIDADLEDYYRIKDTKKKQN